MPTGDIYRATIEGHFDGEPVMLDLGFISNSGAADFVTDSNSLAAELRGALGFTSPPSPFMDPLSVHYTVEGVRIQDLAPGVSAGIVVAESGVGANATDDALPPSCALCITWRTGLKGKQNRGRTYLTGFAEDSQNAGYWIPEIQDWANSQFAGPLMAAFGPLGAGNYSLAVVHTVAGGVRLTPPTATPIVGYTVNNTVRTLRRRAVGTRISRHHSAP